MFPPELLPSLLLQAKATKTTAKIIAKNPKKQQKIQE